MKYRENIHVKLVFVRNRNKRSEYIVILSTDTSLSDEEIVRRYGNRWSIECCDDIKDIELTEALERLLAIFLFLNRLPLSGRKEVTD